MTNDFSFIYLKVNPNLWKSQISIALIQNSNYLLTKQTTIILNFELQLEIQNN